MSQTDGSKEKWGCFLFKGVKKEGGAEIQNDKECVRG